MPTLAATELFAAIRDGDPDKVKQLVTGVPHLVRARDERGITPLVLASYLGDLPTTEVLVEAGADVNVGGGTGTALMGVAFRGHHAIAQYLIDKGADVHAVNDQGMTALTFARMGGKPDVEKLLIAAGAK